jgi:CheY-like chemotaxis protein
MPYKLLLADDSVTIQRVIELTFADEDVTVTAVGDGQQAIDRILAGRPDIVLADVDMPGRDGYEVAAFVKDDPSLQHIPVLLLTGAFEPVDDDRVRLVRCDGVLAKPFEPQLLISRVKELLRGVTMSPATPVKAPAIVQSAAPSANAGPGPDAGNALLVPVPDGARAEFDEEATVRMARPPAAPDEGDLRLDVEALNLGRPSAPAAAPDGSLDDYFDRLDAAFAHLTGAQPGREAAAPLRPKAADPWADSAAATTGWPRPVMAPSGKRAASDAGSESAHLRADLVGPGAEQDTFESGRAADAAEAPAGMVAVPLPDAFAALLDAEREHGADTVHQGDVPSAVTVLLPGTAATQAFIDSVARRVLERLGEPAFRDLVPQIVSATAERLIREEIDRVRNLAI